jgi:hypothetical protein
MMNIKARAEGNPSPGLKVPQPAQALMRHELNLCIMLELFDERLTRLERLLGGENADSDFVAYSEAMCFLDSIYFISRTLMDSAAGIVRHYNNINNKGHEIVKSFSDLYKKSLVKELPNNLNKVFSGCEKWFPQLKVRRDAIVHHYETNLIGIGMFANGDTKVTQFSLKDSTDVIEDLRSYIGMMMAGYQCFIDKLLDYWDEMFIDWYKFKVNRVTSILDGRRANILWWAYQYGGYRNDNMVVSKS